MQVGAVVRPVGPEPPSVYWRRRAALLVVLLVVVAAVAYACSGGSGAGTRSGAPAGGVSPSAGPTTTAPTHPARCSDATLRVQASTDASIYPAGVLPRLTLQVTNTSTAVCRLPVQSGSRTWSVFSGTDQVWTTADCAQHAKRSTRKLAAGHSHTWSLVWGRARSTPGTCTATGDTAQPGTYRLVGVVAGVRSTTAVFHLTD